MNSTIDQHNAGTVPQPPAGHSPEDLREDATMFGEWVQDGCWFYAPEQSAFYRMEVDQQPYTFTLRRAKQLYPESESVDASNDTYPISTITELSGELIGGYLVGIPPATTISIDEGTITNTGEYLIINLPKEEVQPEKISHLSLSHNGYNERYISGHPSSMVNELTEAELTQTQTTPRFIFSVNGSRAGINHLLPPKVQSPSPTTVDPSAMTADGGQHPGRTTAGVHPSVEEVPYFPSEDPELSTRFVQTSQHLSNTFKEPNLRRYVLSYMQGRVLNACAGPTDLSQWYDEGEIVTNDIDPEIDSDLSVDVTKLAKHFPPNSFDTIIFDPVWTLYQARLRYNGYHLGKTINNSDNERLEGERVDIDIRELPFKVPGEDAIKSKAGGAQSTLFDVTSSESFHDTESSSTDYAQQFNEKHRDYIEPDKEKTQVGHARLAKLGFNYLLREGGRVIQFSYTGSVMPGDLNYKRLSRATFNATGIYKVLSAGVDMKLSE